jgi:hypothetical protein
VSHCSESGQADTDKVAVQSQILQSSDSAFAQASLQLYNRRDAMNEMQHAESRHRWPVPPEIFDRTLTMQGEHFHPIRISGQGYGIQEHLVLLFQCHKPCAGANKFVRVVNEDARASEPARCLEGRERRQIEVRHDRW